MIKLYQSGAYLLNGTELIAEDRDAGAALLAKTGKSLSREEAKKGTISYSILKNHNRSGGMEQLELRFDAMASHDITFVSVIQTAKASGMESFPIPYVLTNCHNSLCAVGGTLNEDDHQFGLSAAKKYGGIFVPPHQAVIHSYMREMHAACGKMILGSDSHTRYGALGTMAVGEGGGELVKQLLKKTYDISCPEVVCVYLTGKPAPGVGPQDVALAIIGAVFQNGYVKNKIMEFVGDGIGGLSADFRNGIDVMTTETACLSSIWRTDGVIKNYYRDHGRAGDFHALAPESVAYYDGVVHVDLSLVRPMIALPFHPSNAYPIEEVQKNLGDILHETEQRAKALIKGSVHYSLADKVVKGKLRVDQGVIAGCAGGTFENIADAASIIGEHNLGSDIFSLAVYPGSQPVMLALMKQNVLSRLICAGATIRTAFCGPCFGAGDVPANGQLSVRHTTRNFPNREGSKPADGQIASVALMDARSIAATAVRGGILTAATELEGVCFDRPLFYFDRTVYDHRVYDGFGNPRPGGPLRYGPNIVDWPEIGRLEEHLLLAVASVITDPVTTTDELIPSGDASTYRSNPVRMAEFTLSRRDPAYVPLAKSCHEAEKRRLRGEGPAEALPGLAAAFAAIDSIRELRGIDSGAIGLGSLIYAVKPGDGSAREQAASCQRVLGGCANIAREYATKRYRSNLINWGMIPFQMEAAPEFRPGDYIFFPGLREAIASGSRQVEAYLIGERTVKLTLTVGDLTKEERRILLSGSLINYYKEISRSEKNYG